MAYITNSRTKSLIHEFPVRQHFNPIDIPYHNIPLFGILQLELASPKKESCRNKRERPRIRLTCVSATLHFLYPSFHSAGLDQLFPPFNGQTGLESFDFRVGLGTRDAELRKYPGSAREYNFTKVSGGFFRRFFFLKCDIFGNAPTLRKR